MKTIDEILWIEFTEMVDIGVSENTLFSAKSKKYKSWEFMSDPSDNRKVLVKYELLADKYKQALKDKYGNVYDYVAKLPIKLLVKYDLKAEQFYLDYTYGAGKTLTKVQVDKYTKCANWLNMIVEATKDKRELKRKLNLTIDQFYTHTMELFASENVDLPQSYRRLVANTDSSLKQYLESGYASLISKHLGNNKTAKVNDDKCEAVLLSLIAHPNQYDAVFIAQQYNQWAVANGYAPISDKTVINHRQKNLDEITMEREGMAVFKDKISRKIKGMRPSLPTLMLENDDNHLDLFFQNEHSTHLRYKAIVVIDSYNNYVLGYAYSLDLTKEVVKAAYVNAMYHMRSLTGEWVLPHETKSDRWALKELRPFYEGMGTYIDARLGNKHRGYIEQFFGSNHWKNAMKMGAINYSGNNITATNRGVNAEYLAKNQKLRPFIGSEANEQIECFFGNLRHMKQKNGLSKQEEWLNAWNEMPADKKRIISDEQFLMKFGIEHKHRGNGVRIDSKGVRFALDGKQYDYQLPVYRSELLGKSVTVIYDINDMSRVLLTNHDDIRIIAQSTQLIPRALADHTTDTLKMVRQLQAEQTEHVNKVAAKINNRKSILIEYNEDPESILQAGILDKTLRQKAEQQYLNPNPSSVTATEYDPYEDM